MLGMGKSISIAIDFSIAVMLPSIRDMLAIGVQWGSSVGRSCLLLDVAAAACVGLEVEVAKEDQHDYHVACKQVLAPNGEVAADAYGVNGMGEGDAKLDLKQSRETNANIRLGVRGEQS